MIKKLLNKKMKFLFLKNQKGLTLIELLVVIVILGIIAAIAIPMVMGNKETAGKNTNAQNVSVLQDAVNRYYTMNDAYPAALTNLTDKSAKGGPFIEAVPVPSNFKGCSDTAFAYDAATGKVSATTPACVK
ncbi:type II secretion system protein [Cytobacillus massiliigabonensis]|uniref:type II secretion system protein n=1 Tax=Cytobacillus massiliigabonensis TaxID=1871011 RepID=UPI002AC35F7C|nr:prepilin-type N-terminal cleavage/methylation domain-containing protein [Cytobacillus massiliigabonensis]